MRMNYPRLSSRTISLKRTNICCIRKLSILALCIKSPPNLEVSQAWFTRILQPIGRVSANPSPNWGSTIALKVGGIAPMRRAFIWFLMGRTLLVWGRSIWLGGIWEQGLRLLKLRVSLQLCCVGWRSTASDLDVKIAELGYRQWASTPLTKTNCT